MTFRTMNIRVGIWVWILMGIALSGCATSRPDLTWQHFGVRPDEPKLEIVTKDTTKCGEYEKYVTYSQQLQEAYHSRATQNRGWIYVAGILGLGVAAASGALAAATAVGAGTLALLAVSGGFAAGSFVTINNPYLAETYTIAANRVDAALKESEAKRLSTAGEDCKEALAHLKTGIWEARTKLEESRTNNAVGALDRAKRQQESLNALITAVEASRLTASPDTLIFEDPTKVDLAVTLKGGKPGYKVGPKPPKVKVDAIPHTDAFKITSESSARDEDVAGDIVFFDSSKPPLTFAVPIKKKASAAQ